MSGESLGTDGKAQYPHRVVFNVKALLFERQGLENLELRDVDTRELREGEVRLRVTLASVNPVDILSVEKLRVSPMPHIPGSEFTGVVKEVGEGVENVKEGQKVAVYTRLFDGKCDMCMRGEQTYCVNGKRMGVEAQGGYAEEVIVPAINVFPSDLPEEALASLPIATLTPYHALRTARVSPGETVVVLGASGNTGSFAVQLAKFMGATVVAVTRKEWVKELGADYVVDYSHADVLVRDITEGRMADVVVNPLGKDYWDLGLKLVGNLGRLVFFGGITGNQTSINLGEIYSRHISLLGTNRGRVSEFVELLRLCRRCKVKVGKVFPLERGVEAMMEFKSGSRDGRIFIKVN